MSDKVFNALFTLKKFNYNNIYSYSLTKEEKEYYKKGMNKIYSIYLKDIETENKESSIYKYFLNTQNEKYLKNTNNKRKVIDFIAGMTDELFLNEIQKNA